MTSEVSSGKEINPQWPFAPDSTGVYLGVLKMGRFRRAHIWQAQGGARLKFEQSIREKLLSHARQNSAKLDEPDSILILSLFMVGQTAERTKPTIMLQSDDKKIRRETFCLLRDSGILHDYPGFELGCCPLSAEFEGLHLTGRTMKASWSTLCDNRDDIGTYIPGFTDREGADWLAPDPRPDNWTSAHNMFSEVMEGSDLAGTFVVSSALPKRDSILSASRSIQEGTLLFSPDPSDPLSLATRSGTAAGFVRVCGRTMLLTVNHIRSGRIALLRKNELEYDDESDSDCEITGLEDDYASQDEALEPQALVDATSRGSQSPKSVSSTRDASSTSGDRSPVAYSLSHQGKQVQSEEPEVKAGVKLESTLRFPSQPTNHPSRPEATGMTTIGEVVFSSSSLDFCLIELDSSVTDVVTSSTCARDLREPDTPILVSSDGEPQIVEHISRATDIYLRAGRSGTVRGRLQQFSHDVKLPLSTEFQPIYTIQLDTPLGNGDSGSMVRDVATGGVFGFVTAVNRTGYTAIVIPAISVLTSIKEAVNCKILGRQRIQDDRASVPSPSSQWPNPPLHAQAGMGTQQMKGTSPDGTYPISHACVCGKTFSRIDALKRHIQGAANLNMIRCPLCEEREKQFARRDHLRQHLRMFHKLTSQSLQDLMMKL